jgi:hypothetical protein
MRTPDLAFQSVGVAGFEPTASSSRTRVECDEQYQRVLWRARGWPRRAPWCRSRDDGLLTFC